MLYTAPRKPTPGVLRAPGAILLMSCYELGHQPLGLAWPKAFLERAGYVPATIDLAVEALDEPTLRQARLIAIAVPMHTALRLGVRAAERIRRVNPACRIVFHGLYALLNAAYLLDHVADAVLGGETEVELVGLVQRLEAGTEPSPLRQAVLGRLDFPIPSRAGLPALTRYVSLLDRGRVVPSGYVEARRGCLHRCLHCPIPPVYEGRFFAVPREVVLEDVRRLVQAGAGHITFGDPDFLNGPGHALKLVRALHPEFHGLTYDFTAKVEHVLEQEALVPQFAATGCLFVVSALESLSNLVLAHLGKGHSRADALAAGDPPVSRGPRPGGVHLPVDPSRSADGRVTACGERAGGACGRFERGCLDDVLPPPRAGRRARAARRSDGWNGAASARAADTGAAH